MKKTNKITIFLLIFFITIPLSVKAVNVKNSDSIIIAEDQIITGNLYANSSDIQIKGTVNGDLIAASQNIDVSGKILGDIISVSENLTVTGEVDGNIRSLASKEIYINNSVGKNLTVLTKNLKIGPKAEIAWDALIGSSSTDIQGKIKGNIDTFTEKLFLAGSVNKNVNVFLPNKQKDENVQISDQAKISGDFNYYGEEKLDINESNVEGSVVFNEKENNKKNNILIWRLLLSIFSSLVVGLILINIFKKTIHKFNGRLTENIEKKLLPGLLLFIAIPVICFILMLTIIGFPLALITLILWSILLYLTKIFAGISLGYVIRKKIFKLKNKNLMKDLIIGVPIILLIFKIPFAGPTLSLLTIIIVLGNIWLNKKCLLKK